MKIRIYTVVLVVSCLLASALILSVKSRFQTKQALSPPSFSLKETKQIIQSNIVQVLSTNTLSKQLDASKQTIKEEFTVIIDSQSGRCAIINSNNVVTLKEKNGEVVWSSDIAELVKTDQIRSMDVSGNYISIRLAKKWKTEISVNIKTGKVGLSIY